MQTLSANTSTCCHTTHSWKFDANANTDVTRSDLFLLLALVLPSLALSLEVIVYLVKVALLQIRDDLAFVWRHHLKRQTNVTPQEIKSSNSISMFESFSRTSKLISQDSFFYFAYSNFCQCCCCCRYFVVLPETTVSPFEWHLQRVSELGWIPHFTVPYIQRLPWILLRPAWQINTFSHYLFKQR